MTGKLELVEKAYVINSWRIEEEYFACKEPAYGKRGKAKLEILSNNDGIKNYLGEELTFLNIPISRAKEYDKFIFEGEVMSKPEIEQITQDRKRENYLNKLLSNKDITHCYIKKGSYYRPNSCGYTDMRHRAGVYTKVDAVSHAKSCSDIWLVNIDINEHNEMIEKEILDLQTRLIK